jgi:glycosyltransferase involved in cell wall biosynthesis
MIDFFIINGRFLSQKPTGVHRYAFEMCNALHKLGCNFIVLAPKNILSDYNFDFKVKQIGNMSSHLWEQIELPLYLSNHYKNTILISFSGLGCVLHKKNICTIHDLSYLENPKWFSKFYYYLYKYLTPITAKNAIKVLTVSEFSKNEICKKLKIERNKVEVIYNAVSDQITNLDSEPIVKEKIILSVSSLDPRKNFIRLIKAYESLENCDYKLVVVGKNDRVFRNVGLNLENNTNIFFTGYLSDMELKKLYSKAALFVYPSLYEGFGIPNLEAMSNGCPVLTSNIPPHIEVCQEAAIYFDPLNEKDIANQISELIHNTITQKKLIKLGSQRVSQFSWTNSAKKLISLLKQINY